MDTLNDGSDFYTAGIEAGSIRLGKYSGTTGAPIWDNLLTFTSPYDMAKFAGFRSTGDIAIVANAVVAGVKVLHFIEIDDVLGSIVSTLEVSGGGTSLEMGSSGFPLYPFSTEDKQMMDPAYFDSGVEETIVVGEHMYSPTETNPFIIEVSYAAGPALAFAIEADFSAGDDTGGFVGISPDEDGPGITITCGGQFFEGKIANYVIVFTPGVGPGGVFISTLDGIAAETIEFAFDCDLDSGPDSIFAVGGLSSPGGAAATQSSTYLIKTLAGAYVTTLFTTSGAPASNDNDRVFEVEKDGSDVIFWNNAGAGSEIGIYEITAAGVLTSSFGKDLINGFDGKIFEGKILTAGRMLEHLWFNIIERGSFIEQDSIVQTFTVGGSPSTGENIKVDGISTSDVLVTYGNDNAEANSFNNGWQQVAGDVPEFSLTTMLMAVLISGFVLMFVIRRRK